MTYTKIPVDIDVDALKKIAEIGGGQFFRAADTDAMSNVYETINQLETTHVATKKFEHTREFFQWALYPGLFFLGLEIVLAHTRLRRVP
jgi:Ca-activated chloride channel family protein